MSSNAIEKALWETEGEEKRESVKQMFAEIAPSYDKVNAILSLQQDHKWRKKAVEVLRLTPGNKVLDLCCGTADFYVPLKEAVGDSGTVIGVDFCQPMLEIATSKTNRYAFSLGDACQIPVQTATVDAVTVGWGLRNVPDLEKALTEILRILKPGGRLASVDMSKPNSAFMQWGSKIVLNTFCPMVGRVFGNTRAYQYLPKSNERFLSRKQLIQVMTKCGFKNVHDKGFMFGNIGLVWGEKP